jgi:hypothetical protein
MDAPVCCLNPPLEESVAEFAPANAIRKKLFSAKTKKERNYWIFVYANQFGLFSNMDEEEKPKARQIIEWYQI